MKTIIILFCLLAVFCGCAGYFYVQQTTVVELKQTIASKDAELIAQNIRIADLEQIITSKDSQIAFLNQSITELGKVAKQPIKLREFSSRAELENWIPQLIVPGGDCDDYALLLVKLAHKDGFEMSTQIMNDHMLNSTVIGNEVYFIEPQTSRVWLWGFRD